MITILQPITHQTKEGALNTADVLIELAIIRSELPAYLYIRAMNCEPLRVELTGFNLERTVESQLFNYLRLQNGTAKQNSTKEHILGCIETGATLNAIITTDQTAEDIRAILCCFQTTKTKGNIKIKPLKLGTEPTREEILAQIKLEKQREDYSSKHKEYLSV